MSQSAEYSPRNWWGEDEDGTTSQAGGQKYKDNGQGTEWGHRHFFTEGTDPAEQKAFRILREYGGADHLCGRTLTEEPWNGGRSRELFAWLFNELSEPWADPDGWPVDGRGDQLHRKQRPITLSEPDLMPTWLPAAQCTEKRRNQPDTGYINWGQTTWVVLEELGKDQFLAAFREWLAVRNYRIRHGLSNGNGRELDLWEQRKALDLARGRKSDPEINSDIEALKLAVERVQKQADPNEPNPFTNDDSA